MDKKTPKPKKSIPAEYEREKAFRDSLQKIGKRYKKSFAKLAK